MAFEDKQYVPAKRYYDSFSQLAEQNARSLLLGIRLANIHQDRDTAASLALLCSRRRQNAAGHAAAARQLRHVGRSSGLRGLAGQRLNPVQYSVALLSRNCD